MTQRPIPRSWRQASDVEAIVHQCTTELAILQAALHYDPRVELIFGDMESILKGYMSIGEVAVKHPKFQKLMELQLKTLQKLCTTVNGYKIETELTTDELPEPKKRDTSAFQRGTFHMNAGTFVYVARNAKSEVLYIGVTDNLFGRMAGHKSASPWWPEMESLDWTEWPDRVTALKQEARLIKSFRPRHNRTHNPDARRTAS